MSAIRLKVSELERVKGKVCEMRVVGGVLTPKKVIGEAQLTLRS